MTTFQLILDWSEVWALLIPMFVSILKNRQPPLLKPITVYLWLAFLLNLVIDLISEFHMYFPSWPHSNTFLYNIHSIIRFTCFIYFFVSLKQSYSISVARILPLLFIVFLSINFTVFENFLNYNYLSGNLLAAESYFLLIYCMLYYLSQLRGEVEVMRDEKDFWIVTGLSMYVVINFFIFLFYVPMITENPPLANRMWDIHNVAYIILCLFITKAYYVPVRPEY